MGAYSEAVRGPRTAAATAIIVGRRRIASGSEGSRLGDAGTNGAAVAGLERPIRVGAVPKGLPDRRA